MDCIPDGTDQLSRDYLKTTHILSIDLNSFQYHPSSPVNLLSEHLYEKKVAPLFQPNSARAFSDSLKQRSPCSNCLALTELTGGAKVFMWTYTVGGSPL